MDSYGLRVLLQLGHQASKKYDLEDGSIDFCAGIAGDDEHAGLACVLFGLASMTRV